MSVEGRPAPREAGEGGDAIRAQAARVYSELGTNPRTIGGVIGRHLTDDLAAALGAAFPEGELNTLAQKPFARDVEQAYVVERLRAAQSAGAESSEAKEAFAKLIELAQQDGAQRGLAA